MTNLYNYLISTEPIQGYVSKTQEFEPHHDEAIAVDMITPTLETVLGLKGTVSGIKAFKDIKPFLGDIWHGRNLLFGNNTKAIGKNYYKNYIHPYNVNNKIMGNVSFPNSMAGKIKAEYVEQLPFLRYFTHKNKNVLKVPNNKNRLDANGFYNMKTNWKGKNYDYQYKINKYSKEPEFYNIKPYELFEEEVKSNNLFDFLQ